MRGLVERTREREQAWGDDGVCRLGAEVKLCLAGAEVKLCLACMAGVGTSCWDCGHASCMGEMDRLLVGLEHSLGSGPNLKAC